MIARTSSLILAAISLTACAPDGALWVRVEAPFLVPQEANGLRLLVRREDGERALDRTWSLDEGLPFPQTLTLLEEDGDRGPLEVHGTVLLNGDLAKPWAEARVTTTVEPGALREVVLRICDCAAEEGP